jgi:DNA-binding NarL/FixJ family response regulator
LTVRADSSDSLLLGRSAFARKAWVDARNHLTAADAAAPLAAGDLELLATAAYLTGHDEASVDVWTRAHTSFLQDGDAARAARCVFWIVLELINRGAQAPAMGWLQRAFQFLDEIDCPEQGMLLVLRARNEARQGNRQASAESARAAAELADRFDDPELAVLSGLSLAHARARAGHSTEAAMLLDELMVAVTVGNVSPIAVGVVYCAMIEACQAIHDVARAREWTAALSRWCESQPDLVPFRGQCQVHRCEILRLSGDWSRAIAEVEQACAWMTESAARLAPSSSGAGTSTFTYPIGAAHYERAEVYRMRAEFSRAEDAYRLANEFGHSPEPGLALLRLAQGRADAAAVTIRRLLAEGGNPGARARLLSAAVEVLLAVDDRPAAGAAEAELTELACAQGSAYLRALSAQAAGGILLANGEPAAALRQLRTAWMTWQELEAPYDAARVRVLLALGCRALGDQESAGLELDAARRVFERLEAGHDIAIVDRLVQSPGRATGGLTARERDVIRLIATGITNRVIAERLGISERTVDRHVSNILRKLDLPSRSAASAYAVEHGLA